MSFYDVVECPYCGHDHDMDTYDFDGSNEVDIECESCEKEFEVIREWYPSYSSHSIEYVNCESCKRELRRGDNVYKLKGKELCLSCYGKEYFADINEESN